MSKAGNLNMIPALLDGLRVLDLTDARGLYAGRMLADLGAEVIHVEPAEGNTSRKVGPWKRDSSGKESSLFWESFSCNKLGLCCDIKTRAGRELISKLCCSCDVLIESADPGVMVSLGLGYADLETIAPQLVYVSITAFGSSGPKADYHASDLTVWAAGGPLFANRECDREPARLTAPQSWLHAGSDAAVGALLALNARTRTGLGQHVVISAQKSAMQSTLARTLSAAVGDRNAERLSPIESEADRRRFLDGTGSGALAGRTKWKIHDGFAEFHVAMGPATGRFTNAVMAWIHEQGGIDSTIAAIDWTDVPRRLRAGEMTFQDVDAVYSVIERFMSMRTKEEIMKVALERRILLAPILDVSDLVRDPHYAAHGLFVDPGSDGSAIPGPYCSSNMAVFRIDKAAPGIGQHTDQILRDVLHMSGNDIASLRAQGVVQ